MVIFGATGDLTKRKLFPSLYYLAKDGFLPDNFAVIGVGRQELSGARFRKQLMTDLKQFIGQHFDAKLIKWFEDRTYYTGGDFDDDKALFTDIKNLLREVTKTHSILGELFLLSGDSAVAFCECDRKGL